MFRKKEISFAEVLENVKHKLKTTNNHNLHVYVVDLGGYKIMSSDFDTKLRIGYTLEFIEYYYDENNVLYRNGFNHVVGSK